VSTIVVPIGKAIQVWADGCSYEGIDPRMSTLWENKKGASTISQTGRDHEAAQKRMNAVEALEAGWREKHSKSGQL